MEGLASRRVSRIVRRWALLAGLVCSWAHARPPPQAPPALASPTAAPLVSRFPTAAIDWIDPRGKLVSFGKQLESKWLWGKVSETDAVERLFLRVWLEIPAGYQVRSWHGTVARLLVQGQRITVDILSTLSQAELTLKGPGDKNFYVTALVRVTQQVPLYWIDASCTALRFGVGRNANSRGNFLYLAAKCREDGDSVELTLLHSSDARLGDGNLPPREAAGTGWVRYRVKRPALDAGSAAKPGLTTLAQFTLTDPEQKSEVHALLAFPSTDKPRRWIASASLGVTTMLYNEEPDTRNLTELGITAKANASFSILPRTLDVGANGFFTLVPFLLDRAPPETPPTRSYGINGRLGYRVPIDAWGADYFVMAGWYFWGMLVPDNSYGLAFLTGPQIFLTLRKPLPHGQSFAVYFKLAPMSDAWTFKLSNRELAFGGSFSPGWKILGRGVSFTLDIANAAFQSELVNNSIQMTTFSLGFAREF